MIEQYLLDFIVLLDLIVIYVKNANASKTP